MEKVIIVLDGTPKGKTEFTQTAKDNGYWVWSINHLNVLTAISHKLYWGGSRNKQFYDFISEFSEMVNRYWEFEDNYVASMLEKFFHNDRTSTLIIHSCSSDLRVRLCDRYENCWSVKITESLCEDDGYQYILDCNADNYNSVIVDLLKTLSNTKVE